jgi:hypothetical protein
MLRYSYNPMFAPPRNTQSNASAGADSYPGVKDSPLRTLVEVARRVNQSGRGEAILETALGFAHSDFLK